MRCGEKCFQVEIEIGGQNKMTTVNARSPAEARRTTRKEYGGTVSILSARKKKRP